MSSVPADPASPGPRTSIPFDATVWLATAAVLVGLAIQVRRGRFDEVALLLAALAGVLAMSTLRGRTTPAPITTPGERVRLAVRGLLVVHLVAFVPLLDVHLLDRAQQPGSVIAGVLFVVVAVLGWDQLADAPITGGRGRGALVAAVGGLGLLWLAANPTGIDVLMFQEVGVDRLLSGENPWTPGYPNPYSPAQTAAFYGPGLVEDGQLNFGYPYPPLALLLAVPGTLVGDLRVMHLLAMLGAGALMLTMVRDSWASRAGGVLFLTSPMLLRVVEWGFTEAFMILTLAAALWTLRRGMGVASVVTLGLFLASKQYAVLFLPVILWVTPTLRTTAERWWLTWRAVLLAAVITVPPALWHVGDFVFSVAVLQFHQPFRADSLSLLAFSVNTWNVPPEGAFLAVIMIATAAGMWWTLARAPRIWWGVAAGIATVQLAFLLFNKQAFTNYYLFAAAVLCMGIALRDADIHSPDIGRFPAMNERADWTESTR